MVLVLNESRDCSGVWLFASVLVHQVTVVGVAVRKCTSTPGDRGGCGCSQVY